MLKELKASCHSALETDGEVSEPMDSKSIEHLSPLIAFRPFFCGISYDSFSIDDTLDVEQEFMEELWNAVDEGRRSYGVRWPQPRLFLALLGYC